MVDKFTSYNNVIKCAENIIRSSNVGYTNGAGTGYVPPYALRELRDALREHYSNIIEVAGLKE